jgi:protein-tyrosine phosphatase
MKRILFVCSGNTCRSPLAEAIAKQVLPGRLDFDVEIASAGTSALDGSPASRNSVEVAERHGLDLSPHRSRLLTRELLHDADLVVTMGVRHREAVEDIDPDSVESTFLLTNFSDVHNGDIPDPIGNDLAVYERTYLVIRDCIESMTTKLHHFDGWKKTGKGGRK